MATTFESISLKGLRLAHLRQLKAYIKERDITYNSGWYYGSKGYFQKRHEELLKWVNDAIEYAESPDVRMPK